MFSIVDAIGKRTGVEFKGPCPFNHEKTFLFSRQFNENPLRRHKVNDSTLRCLSSAVANIETVMLVGKISVAELTTDGKKVDVCVGRAWIDW